MEVGTIPPPSSPSGLQAQGDQQSQVDSQLPYTPQFPPHSPRTPRPPNPKRALPNSPSSERGRARQPSRAPSPFLSTFPSTCDPFASQLSFSPPPLTPTTFLLNGIQKLVGPRSSEWYCAPSPAQWTSLCGEMINLILSSIDQPFLGPSADSENAKRMVCGYFYEACRTDKVASWIPQPAKNPSPPPGPTPGNPPHHADPTILAIIREIQGDINTRFAKIERKLNLNTKPNTDKGTPNTDQATANPPPPGHQGTYAAVTAKPPPTDTQNPTPPPGCKSGPNQPKIPDVPPLSVSSSGSKATHRPQKTDRTLYSSPTPLTPP
ncbi:hypothetical protein AX17_007251 [Amanita inopinata Kibby_2008]|nr:hypothetical protein AX17_007251 [Amanita inopinata Kibby_2008]